jgi:hypothetical protein
MANSFGYYGVAAWDLCTQIVYNYFDELFEPVFGNFLLWLVLSPILGNQATYRLNLLLKMGPQPDHDTSLPLELETELCDWFL